MRQAIANAEVGDDYYRDDPTVDAFQAGRTHEVGPSVADQEGGDLAVPLGVARAHLQLHGVSRVANRLAPKRGEGHHGAQPVSRVGGPPRSSRPRQDGRRWSRSP